MDTSIVYKLCKSLVASTGIATIDMGSMQQLYSHPHGGLVGINPLHPTSSNSFTGSVCIPPFVMLSYVLALSLKPIDMSKVRMT